MTDCAPVVSVLTSPTFIDVKPSDIFTVYRPTGVVIQYRGGRCRPIGGHEWLSERRLRSEEIISRPSAVQHILALGYHVHGEGTSFAHATVESPSKSAVRDVWAQIRMWALAEGREDIAREAQKFATAGGAQ